MDFASKLGASYTQVKEQLKIKTITIENGENKFNLKVRIPLKAEMEGINKDINNPPQALIDKYYKDISDPIKETAAKAGVDALQTINKDQEYITITDDDVVLNGNSCKQYALFSAMWHVKVEKYFHLLVSEIAEPVNESFEQLMGYFPEEVIKQIVEEIEKAIKPDYNHVKKN